MIVKRFQTSETVTERNLSEKEFLLYFSIIPDKGFNISRLETHGYPTLFRFFTGASTKYGGFDWNGLDNSSIQSETFHFHLNDLHFYQKKAFQESTMKVSCLTVLMTFSILLPHIFAMKRVVTKVQMMELM